MYICLKDAHLGKMGSNLLDKNFVLITVSPLLQTLPEI
jgi:hypothetical protein